MSARCICVGAPPHGKVYSYEVCRGADRDHLAPLMPLSNRATQCLFPAFSDRNVPHGHWCYAVRGVWFTATNPSETKFTEFTPLLEVDVP